MSYIIRLNQGDYYEWRGGMEWSRTSRDAATRFRTEYDAERVAQILRSFGAEVEEVG
jgi:hypothetical protein